MFNRSMDFVARGYTAALSLSGSGLSNLTDYLSTATERTSYSIGVSDVSPPNTHNA